MISYPFVRNPLRCAAVGLAATPAECPIPLPGRASETWIAGSAPGDGRWTGRSAGGDGFRKARSRKLDRRGHRRRSDLGRARAAAPRQCAVIGPVVARGGHWPGGYEGLKAETSSSAGRLRHRLMGASGTPREPVTSCRARAPPAAPVAASRAALPARFRAPRVPLAALRASGARAP
jgi:hypothetical protein